jgi:diaminohydroxyphosphoribosylaminopyrimidine deaminase/5-amino-6-(5-phosphoribosylamino)uracil reductase
MLSSYPHSLTDSIWMNRALDLASLGRLSTRPNPAVGCVLIKQGQLIGEGWHQRAGEPHAEVLALRMAGDRARGATAYVTLEPCSHFGKTPPCCNALITAGIKRVVIAMIDPNPRVSGRGIAALQGAGIEVTQGVAMKRAQQLNKGFVSRMQRGRPNVSLKLATSVDAKVALANGQSQWITNAQARTQGHLLRAQQCAIITGIASVITDDPRLTVRLDDSAFYAQGWLSAGRVEPMKVVVDSRLRIPLNAKLCQQADALIIYTTRATLCAQADKVAQLAAKGITVHGVDCDPQHRVNLVSVLAHLASHYQCNNVMLESGGVLAGAMLSIDCVDEIHWFSAPLVLGQDAQSCFVTQTLTQLSQAPRLRLVEQTMLGDNVYSRYQLEKE